MRNTTANTVQSVHGSPELAPDRYGPVIGRLQLHKVLASAWVCVTVRYLQDKAFQCCKALLKQQVVLSEQGCNMDQMLLLNLTGKHLISARSTLFLARHKYLSGCHVMLGAASQFLLCQVGGNPACTDCAHGLTAASCSELGSQPDTLGSHGWIFAWTKHWQPPI